MAGNIVRTELPEQLYDAIEEIAERSGRDVAGVVAEMLEEAVKMRRVRGIVFADEFERREAKVGGTGLGVWEVIETYQHLDEDWNRFKGYYDWLGEDQLGAALAYWRAYPDEINEMIRENESWTQEKVWEAYPVTKPSWVPTEEDWKAAFDDQTKP